MLRLVIETATQACSVALVEDGRLIGERHEIVGRGHAERLVPQIGELMAEAGRPAVAAILVDCGPGSFTGIRVGLAAAKALGFGWGVPVHGFSSLALIAAASAGEAAAATVAIPGGHGELFVQRFAGTPPSPSGELLSLAPAAAAAMADPLVLGAGAAALVALRGSGEARDATPRAADARLLPAPLATLAPTPLYGRAPDARPAA